jgi:DNA-directed RNA polymerase subunit RPC12/RpoP
MASSKYPHDHENDVIYFGKVNFRNRMKVFGIKTDDRRRHMYIVGKTGMGKTTLLENLFLSDVYAGHGCCYVDPHGDTADKLLNFIPSWRINDVVYFDPSDLDYPIGFNILEAVDPRLKHLVAAGLMGVFKKIWEGVWSARMEYIMNNTILALLDTPGTTLLGINRMLSDKDYRNKIISNVQDPIVKQFWIQEFGNYQDKFASEAVAPIQNKVGQFLSASIIRNIVAQAKSTIKVREMMDEQKIFIVNLSKGKVGEDASRLLGGMLITKIQMAAMERVDMDEEDRNDFYLYVDEFQNFAVESFASILSEARKYRLNLIMAHQYIAQLTEEVRDAVFGNVGSMVTFRVGSTDAQFMEDEFMPRFTPENLINLPKYQVYLKLMIDGVTSQPFSANTLPPIAQVTGTKDRVIEQSRERYAGNKEEIEQHVMKWSGFGDDVDIEEKMQEVKEAKKAAKKQRFMHTYDCTRCAKKFDLPVELDKSRPIYCEDCHPIVKEENKKRKERGGSKNRDRNREKRVNDVPPKPKDGKIVEKEVKGEASLSELKSEEKKSQESESDAKKKRETKSDGERSQGDRGSEGGSDSQSGDNSQHKETKKESDRSGEKRSSNSDRFANLKKMDGNKGQGKPKKSGQDKDSERNSSASAESSSASSDKESVKEKRSDSDDRSNDNRSGKKSNNEKGSNDDSDNKPKRKRKRRRRKRKSSGDSGNPGDSTASHESSSDSSNRKKVKETKSEGEKPQESKGSGRLDEMKGSHIDKSSSDSGSVSPGEKVKFD